MTERDSSDHITLFVLRKCQTIAIKSKQVKQESFPMECFGKQVKIVLTLTFNLWKLPSLLMKFSIAS